VANLKKTVLLITKFKHVNKILPFLLFIISLQLSAQEERVIIHGIIFSDSLTVDNVNIVNKTTFKGTVSNKNGEFQILARENDILQFSNIQYKTKKVYLNKIHLKRKELIIHLMQKTTELQEVVVHNMAKSLGLPNAGKEPLKPTERKINYYTKGGSISKLYGLISGDSKRLKSLRKLEKEDEEVLTNKLNIQIIRNHFQDEFFIETLKIPKERIDDLITYCLPKGIVFLFDRERYLEVMDILIQNKYAYLNATVNPSQME